MMLLRRRSSATTESIVNEHTDLRHDTANCTIPEDCPINDEMNTVGSDVNCWILIANFDIITYNKIKFPNI